MQAVNVRETREKLAALLDAVAAGEEILILRNGRPVARLTSPPPEAVTFPDRSALRSGLPPMQGSAASAVRASRDEERF
jgi:prevent-host-death family protein